MEKGIIKIIIKGYSGYCPIELAYSDRITLTQNSIKYEYTPHPMSELETNVRRKWSYTTDSLIFSELYERIAEQMPEILNRELYPFCRDIGGTEFIITYGDKSKFSKTHWLPSDEFKECFDLIRMMVPKTEYMPVMLIMSEDFEEEDDP